MCDCGPEFVCSECHWCTKCSGHASVCTKPTGEKALSSDAVDRMMEIYRHREKTAQALLRRYRESHASMALTAQEAGAANKYKTITAEVDEFLAHPPLPTGEGGGDE